MSSQAPPTTIEPPSKLPRLPKTHHITKRPLLHPAIASPYTNASVPKIIYIRANTPFISTVKRVRKYLDHIETRASSSGGKKIELSKFDNSRKGDGGDRALLGVLREEVMKRAKEKNGHEIGGEEVLIKGTGKAIQRVLQLGVYFQGQSDVQVRFRTGSVGAVDDIRVKDGVDEQDAEGNGDGDPDVPETQVRRTSCLEVGVSLR